MARLEKAIEDARAAGYIGKTSSAQGSMWKCTPSTARRVHLREETALLESLEGRKAIPG